MRNAANLPRGVPVLPVVRLGVLRVNDKYGIVEFFVLALCLASLIYSVWNGWFGDYWRAFYFLAFACVLARSR